MAQTDDIPSEAQAHVLEFLAESDTWGLPWSAQYCWEMERAGWIKSRRHRMCYVFKLTAAGRAALARYREHLHTGKDPADG